MNVNAFYNELYYNILGLDVLGLESKLPQLTKLVESRTLTTFSSLIPAKVLIYLDLSDTAHIIKKDQQTLGVEYLLDDDILTKFNLPILDIDKIEYNNVGDVDPYDPNSSAYYSSIIASRQNLSLESVLMGAEYTYNRTLTDFAMPFKRYHELRGNNILYLRNYAFGGTVEVTVKTKWPNIVSIPEEYREILLTLSKLDIKQSLWHSLKYLESIVTPSGNLDLKISDWDSAERDRDDYIKELRTKSFTDRIGPRYFTLV